MILQRLRLKDFRQYRGEHEVSFATDPIRNVTVVTGVNGAGKTGLFYALNWVLYGPEGIFGPLVNKAAANDERFAKCFAELHFLHEGQRFVARREQAVTASGAEQEETFRLEIHESGGRVKDVPNPAQRMNVILPRDARRYFFFDGERIDELSRPGHEDQVRHAVSSVLKLKVLERARIHLRDIEKEYAKAFRDTNLDSEQEQLVEAIEGLQASLEIAQAHISDLKVEEASISEQLASTRAKLEAVAELESIQAKENDLVDRLAPLRLGLETTSTQLREAIALSAAALAGGAISAARRTLDEKRARGEIPSGIQQQLIEDLLRDGTCICARPLDAEARAVLRARHEATVPTGIADALNVAAAELRAGEVRAEGALRSLRDLINRRTELQDQLTDSERALDELRSQLESGQYTEDVARLAKTRTSLEHRLIDIRADLKSEARNMDEARQQLDGASARLTRIQAKTSEGVRAQHRFETAMRAAEAAAQLETRFSADMRAQIETASNDIFQRIVWKKEQFPSVTITEDYRLEVTDRFGSNALVGLSAGERQVLSLAFMAGMSKVTGEEAPLVIDTPFGRLSEAPVESIIGVLPSISKQLVLLVTDREIDADAARALASKIGREYVLRFDDNLGQTSIEAVR